ncbi:hypothetical protein BpHYR1_030857 [Brachionus plicatilis]|uniref:Uncharacterized protein n=1 Tax=Brachionus plicatilis TaxID=10195 RepID=A0A3M7Q2M0_BRAPC|nr:hypothetical protein BpHYR1_030857 [Brachionus plicatilis]
MYPKGCKLVCKCKCNEVVLWVRDDTLVSKRIDNNQICLVSVMFTLVPLGPSIRSPSLDVLEHKFYLSYIIYTNTNTKLIDVLNDKTKEVRLNWTQSKANTVSLIQLSLNKI